MQTLPTPDPDADVRLWVDRCFTIKGAGTVVTGTLQAGTVRSGDTLATGTATLRVRGVQSLGRPVDQASGVARVALNVSGENRAELDRHSVLVSPGAWRFAEVLDVRLRRTGGRPDDAPPVDRCCTSARPRCRRTSGRWRRPRPADPRPAPAAAGRDAALLRDPGSRRIWGLTVLDPAPPSLGRRGAARERAAVLASAEGHPDPAAELARRGVVHLDLLRQIGVPAETSAASQRLAARGTRGRAAPAAARGPGGQARRS